MGEGEEAPAISEIPFIWWIEKKRRLFLLLCGEAIDFLGRKKESIFYL